MISLHRVVLIPVMILAVPALGFLMSSALVATSGRLRLIGGFILDGRKAGPVLWVASASAVALGFALICIVYLAAAFCRSDRRRLAAVFAPLVRFLSLGVAGLGVLQMFIVVLSLALAMLAFVHILPLGVMLAIVLGAFYTAEELARIGMTLSKPVAGAVNGVAVSRDAQPGLWRLLDDVALRIGARLPDHVVIGLAPGFFATGGKSRLPDGRVLEGETLYVPLPSLRLLSEPELAAVLGHELSHFVGEDIAFSLRFMPIYQRLGDAIQTVHITDHYGALTAMPAKVVLREAALAFARAERRIRRERETAADRMGVAAASAPDLVAAMLRERRVAASWPMVVRELVAAINAGVPPPDVSARLAHVVEDARASAGQGSEDLDPGWAAMHPGFAARASALGAELEERPPPGTEIGTSAAGVLTDGERLEAEVALVFCRSLIEEGFARPPRDPNRPNYLEKKRRHRVAQAEARRRRLDARVYADG